VKPLPAELVETREFLPGQWLQTYSAPKLASGAQAGQYLQLRTPDHSGVVMRRPFAINTYDRRAGTITLHFRSNGVGPAWLARLGPGDSIQMFGPFGRPFEVDPRSRHVLLVARGAGMAGVRALVDESLLAHRQVTLLFGATSASEVYPSSLLPDEVEYIVSTDDGSFGDRGRVTELVPRFEAWADQCFACGPQSMLTALAAAAASRQRRLGVAALGPRRGKSSRAAPPGSPQARRRAWLQVAIEQNMGCPVGACLGCVIMGVDGPQRVCREGPVFAWDEIAWEARWP
jgi:dihydroorotate dehydrogenase electron transfer subunit